jgi:hypothetical protein
MENIVYITLFIIAFYYYILLNIKLNNFELCIDHFYNYEQLA